MDLDFSPFPILKTDRLVLRQLTANDAPEVRQLRSDDRINEFLARSGSITMEDAQRFITMVNDNISKNQSLYWVITLKESDILIGAICLLNLSLENHSAEIGYELSVANQGRGLMQEAIESVIDYAFVHIGFKVITAWLVENNIRSVKSLRRNGFILDDNFKYASKEEADGLVVYYLLDKRQRD